MPSVLNSAVQCRLKNETRPSWTVSSLVWDVHIKPPDNTWGENGAEIKLNVSNLLCTFTSKKQTVSCPSVSALFSQRRVA